MKTIFAILFIITLTVVGAAQAPTPTPSVEPTPSTAAEIKSARELLQKVVEKDQNGNGKTFADILDKGIDLFASYATSIGNVVKSIAPEVFEIMVRQQYAKAIANIAYWVFLPLIFIIVPFVHRRLMYGSESKANRLLKCNNAKFESSEGLRFLAAWASTGAATAFSIAACYYITEAAMILINPKYYAIKDMLDLIKN